MHIPSLQIYDDISTFLLINIPEVQTKVRTQIFIMLVIGHYTYPYIVKSSLHGILHE